MPASNVSQIVDNLFRHDSGRLVSLLTRIFGAGNIELAEDEFNTKRDEHVKFEFLLPFIKALDHEKNTDRCPVGSNLRFWMRRIKSGSS